MKKIFCWLFWLSVVGGIIYLYRTKPQLKEHCEHIKKKISEVMSECKCCQPRGEEEEVEA